MRSTGSFALAGLFFAVIGASVFTTDLSVLVAVAYLALSLVTFITYAIDKWAAMNNRWRTSESTLHMLAVAGGWPGALIAQQTIRHKSRKKAFRIVFWATVILNCAAFAWIHTSAGRAQLERFIGG